MVEVILDTIMDTLKLLPFLWFTFLLIEVIEHKYQKKSQKIIQASGKFGPLLGGFLGIFPQCGFSVMATNLYVIRIISMGTLISIYLSTSDEMLPILLAESASIQVIFFFLFTKVIIGIVSGFLIDFLVREKRRPQVEEMCKQEHCHCEKGVFSSSLMHTLHIGIFIFITTFFINSLMHYGLEEYLRSIFHSKSILTPFLSSLIGFIPNCGASIILTELYLKGILSAGSLIAGLLTGSGVAFLVLFKNNKHLRENLLILILVYLIGSVSGVILNFVGL